VTPPPSATFLSIASGSAGAAVLATFAYGIFCPSSTMFCPVISRAHAAPEGTLSLTFDDGPIPGSTDRVLDTLAAAGAHATFFVIGEHARRWPDLVRRMHAEGHVVGNHTASHSYARCFHWWTAWERDLRRADDLIEEAIGERPAFFRPPMGFKTWHLARAVRHTGHRVIAWSRRALDGAPTTADRIVRRLAPASRGEILALHDGHAPGSHRSTDPTNEALPRLLNSFRARGIRSVTLGELLGLPAYAPREIVTPATARAAAPPPPAPKAAGASRPRAPNPPPAGSATPAPPAGSTAT